LFGFSLLFFFKTVEVFSYFRGVGGGKIVCNHLKKFSNRNINAVEHT
jgi:hypothetical protein